MTENADDTDLGLKVMLLGIQIVLFGRFFFDSLDSLPVMIFGFAVSMVGLFVH